MYRRRRRARMETRSRARTTTIAKDETRRSKETDQKPYQEIRKPTRTQEIRMTHNFMYASPALDAPPK
jgi:hypothetical protein